MKTRKFLFRHFCICGLIFFVSLNNRAYGLCSDGRHPAIQEEYGTSKFVILGIVISKQDISSPEDPQGIDSTVYDVDVYKYFKGSTIPNLKIISENTTSRFPMEVGKKYLLFLRFITTENKSIVDSCGNSGEITNKKTDIEAVSKLSLRGQNP